MISRDRSAVLPVTVNLRSLRLMSVARNLVTDMESKATVMYHFTITFPVLTKEKTFLKKKKKVIYHKLHVDLIDHGQYVALYRTDYEYISTCTALTMDSIHRPVAY